MTVLHRITEEQFNKKLQELHDEFDSKNEEYFREVELPRIAGTYEELEKIVNNKKVKTISDLVVWLRNSGDYKTEEGTVDEVVAHAEETGFLEVQYGNTIPYMTITVDVQGDNFILDNFFNIIRYSEEEQDIETLEDIEIHTLRQYLKDTLVDGCGHTIEVGDEVYYMHSSRDTSKVYADEGKVIEVYPLSRNVRIDWETEHENKSTVKARNCLKKFVVKNSWQNYYHVL